MLYSKQNSLKNKHHPLNPNPKCHSYSMRSQREIKLSENLRLQVKIILISLIPGTSEHRTKQPLNSSKGP